MLKLVSIVACLACSVAAAAADTLAVEQPENDKLVLVPKITVRGTGSPEGSTVNVTLNGATTSTKIAGGTWNVGDLGLGVGANEFRVSLGSLERTVIAVRGDGISAGPRQRVRFLWNDGVDDQIKQLARDSLDLKLSEEQLSSFVARVKTRTVDVFRSRYQGVGNIEIVDQDGDDVQTISMLPIDDSLFGESPYDCGNVVKKQTSKIHVGTYRELMTKQITDWGPMRKTDSLDVRVEDASQALGRTSAHEFGHSLGLTGQVGDPGCVWMDGCDGSHNCEAFNDKHASADRFKDGWHIMDPGNKTINNSRLGEPSSTQRAANRSPAVFETFGASYLRVILPTP